MEFKVNSLRKFYTLILLKDGPRYGYELIKEIEKMLGKNVSPNQVYPFLNLLRKNKLVKVEEKGKRDKKIYCLTRKGDKLVNKLLARCESIIQIAVKSQIKDCYNCGCRIYGNGYEMEIGNKKTLFCCEHCANSFLDSR